MALAFPTFYTQKPKSRTRISAQRIEKEFGPPKLCKGRLPFNKLVATPIIQGVAYAGYLDVNYNSHVPWYEWELYDGMKAINIVGHCLYIVDKTTKLIFEEDYTHGQLFLVLGQTAYNLKPELSSDKDYTPAIKQARDYTLKWGKAWLGMSIKNRCYQGRIMQTEEFMKVWKEALQKEKKGDYPPF